MDRFPTRILSSLIAGLISINISTAADPQRPKLIVGIVVDQLRTDYIEYLRPMFGTSGFNTLLDKGIYIPDVDFRCDIKDPVAATSIIYTGNYPPVSGIPNSEIYSDAERIIIPVLSDKNSLGISTSETLSPSNILLSTLSDEVAIDGDGFTSVYSISANPQQAIIMSGHAGSGAFWINDHDGKWSSTAYYRNYPDFINNRNRRNPLIARIDTMQWRPSRKIEEYPGVPAQKRYYPFRYTFPLSDRDLFRKFKASALSNAEVTDVAIDAIRNLSLGKRADGIDMLSIGYTAAPFKYVGDGDYRVELEDTYLRLDTQLDRLLKSIDKEIGLDNTFIFLSSTGYYDDAVVIDPKFRIPSGEVSLKRVESLLNSYLSAKYGNADYVVAILDDCIHIDRKKLSEKNLDPASVMSDARDFLVRMSGITGVLTLQEILADRSESGIRKSNSIDPKKTGDLFLTFSPGWNVIDDLHYPSGVTPVRSSAVTTPFIMMGPGLNPTTVTDRVDAVAIAPTIASSLHIRSPNGAVSRPAKINY